MNDQRCGMMTVTAPALGLSGPFGGKCRARAAGAGIHGIVENSEIKAGLKIAAPASIPVVRAVNFPQIGIADIAYMLPRPPMFREPRGKYALGNAAQMEGMPA